MDTKQTTTPTHNVNPASNIPDSGSRSEFQTGAVRDAAPGKGIPSEIPPCVIRRLSVRYEEGAIKYDRGNWRKGIPLSRYYDGIMRHAMSAAEGDKSEDHLAAVLFNAAGFMWTEEQIEKGELPADLNDLPFYKAPSLNERAIEAVVDGIPPYQEPVADLDNLDQSIYQTVKNTEEEKKDQSDCKTGENDASKGVIPPVESLNLQMGLNIFKSSKGEDGIYQIDGLCLKEVDEIVNEIVQWCFNNEASFSTHPEDEYPYRITLNRHKFTIKNKSLKELLPQAKQAEKDKAFEVAIDQHVKLEKGEFIPEQLYPIETLPLNWPNEFRIFSDKKLPVSFMTAGDGKTYTHFSTLNGEIVFGESKRKLSESWVGNAGYWVP